MRKKSASLTVILAQLNVLMGDINGNTQKVLHAAHTAKEKYQADIIVFPELYLIGYPPEDLLLRPGLQTHVDKALKTLCEKAPDIIIIVGHPHQEGAKRYNSASVIQHGAVLTRYDKQELPNYNIFDEKRYFAKGEKACTFRHQGVKFGVVICEDLWHQAPLDNLLKQEPHAIISLNASPFSLMKPNRREEVLRQRTRESALPILYVNYTAGQDELIFDGDSIAMDAKGNVQCRAGLFEETLMPVSLEKKAQGPLFLAPGNVAPPRSQESKAYGALVQGVRDYVNKNGFTGALLGLSGGIDSALTLAVAVDALGKDKVHAVMMPSRYTGSLSLTGAEQQANAMGVKYSSISIEPLFESFLAALAEEFAGLPQDTTEENLQARCRGTLLMALSNKSGKIVLITGNKSEMAVGYSTLYGDMAGGFAVLKDVPKTWVYRLAQYRNEITPVIPDAIITRAPSAELSAGQKDQDSLPPYDILDDIIQRYVEEDASIADLVQAGFDAKVVRQITKRIDNNEYKRRQSPPGIRVTSRAFGRDRRYPITSAYHQQQSLLIEEDYSS